MFQGMSIIQILMLGGFTMLILIICSILSIGVILERVFYFWKNSRIKRAHFMESLKLLLVKNDVQAALASCDEAKTPFARVVKTGLSNLGKTKEKVQNAMERQTNLEIKELEKYTSILGTIGGTVVYIGLFGTVIGIIRAFQDIALNAGGGAGISTVITGIAEALVSTAGGISVAVPAVIAFNFLMKKIDYFTTDMDLCASELVDLLRKD